MVFIALVLITSLERDFMKLWPFDFKLLQVPKVLENISAVVRVTIGH